MTSRSIHVLFLPKWYPSEQDRQFGVFVKKHAHAVGLFCHVSVVNVLAGKSSAVTTTDDNGIYTITLTYKKTWNPLLNLYRYFIHGKRGILQAVKRHGKIDISHVHVLNRPALLAMWLKFTQHIPYVVTEHWTGYASGAFALQPAYKRLFAYYAVEYANAVTTVSEQLKTTLTDLGFKNNHSQVIPNVVDIPEFTTNSKHSEKIRMLTVADLVDHQKNVSAVIRLIPEMIITHPHIEYHIIGDGPDKNMLEQLAASINMKDCFIFFHGRQDNETVYRFLQECNFVVVNSITETFSVVTAEALACGKPVICTRSGGPEEFITPETGIVIEKNNPAELKEALIKMIKTYPQFNPEHLKNLVQKKFNKETIGNSFYTLYHTIISSETR